MAPVVIKAKLGDVMRRLSFESEGADLAALKARLAQMFDVGNFRVTFVDEDDDTVTMTTSEDLTAALNGPQHPVYLTLELHDDAAAPSPPAPAGASTTPAPAPPADPDHARRAALEAAQAAQADVLAAHRAAHEAAHEAHAYHEGRIASAAAAAANAAANAAAANAARSATGGGFEAAARLSRRAAEVREARRAALAAIGVGDDARERAERGAPEGFLNMDGLIDQLGSLERFLPSFLGALGFAAAPYAQQQQPQFPGQGYQFSQSLSDSSGPGHPRYPHYYAPGAYPHPPAGQAPPYPPAPHPAPPPAAAHPPPPGAHPPHAPPHGGHPPHAPTHGAHPPHPPHTHPHGAHPPHQPPPPPFAPGFDGWEEPHMRHRRDGGGRGFRGGRGRRGWGRRRGQGAGYGAEFPWGDISMFGPAAAILASVGEQLSQVGPPTREAAKAFIEAVMGQGRQVGAFAAARESWPQVREWLVTNLGVAGEVAREAIEALIELLRPIATRLLGEDIMERLGTLLRNALTDGAVLNMLRRIDPTNLPENVDLDVDMDINLGDMFGSGAAASASASGRGCGGRRGRHMRGGPFVPPPSPTFVESPRHVGHLQKILVNLGYLDQSQVVGNMGVFNDATVAALEKFQREYGLAGDCQLGSYDELTSAALSSIIETGDTQRPNPDDAARSTPGASSVGAGSSTDPKPAQESSA